MKCWKRWLPVLLVLVSALTPGCGGEPVPGPEETARSLFEFEWANDVDSAWDLFHPIWRKHRHQDSFAKYANNTEAKNRVWANDPRSITRSKTFSGSQIPGRALGLVDALGRDKYEFSVVRLAVNYPVVEGYHGGIVEYLITLAKRKERGATWQVISRLDKIGETEFFNW